MKRLVQALAASAVLSCISTGAFAQSAYGCEDLDGFQALPSVEGSNGQFYRVDPELKNFFAFSDETVADVSRLSRELAKGGTTLVYLPIPPKAMVMTESLPQRAYDYGFDPNLATSVYEDTVRRLREAGVVVADARALLSSGSHSQTEPYFKTDYRLTAYGARLAAQSVAQAMTQGFAGGGGASLARAGFARPPSGQVEIDSDMRRILQRHCLIALPKVMTDVFDGEGTSAAVATETAPVAEATPTPAAAPAPAARIGAPAPGFGLPQQRSAQAEQTGAAVVPQAGPAQVRAVGGGYGSKIALVGTEYSATPGIGFAEALQSATGMPVEQLSLSGGGAFGAFSAYVTSDAFQKNRPNVIVWENPIYNNLAQFGDQPMRELIAAASGSCQTPLPVLGALDGTGATADLGGLDPSRDYTLFVDAGGAAAKVAQFVFLSAEGFTRTKTVVRAHPDARTGRFYVPMTGLWPGGARSVDIRLDTAMSGTPRVTACQF